MVRNSEALVFVGKLTELKSLCISVFFKFLLLACLNCQIPISDQQCPVSWLLVFKLNFFFLFLHLDNQASSLKGGQGDQ